MDDLETFVALMAAVYAIFILFRDPWGIGACDTLGYASSGKRPAVSVAPVKGLGGVEESRAIDQERSGDDDQFSNIHHPEPQGVPTHAQVTHRRPQHVSLAEKARLYKREREDSYSASSELHRDGLARAVAADLRRDPAMRPRC